MKKQSKGITLVALVITIIILLILAGITLKTLTGENGILTKVIEGKEEYQKSEEEENKKLDEIEKIMSIKEDIPIITVEDKEKWSGKEGKKVSISTKDGYITKYTIDGSEPSIENGEKYEGEITVTENCIIKAVYIHCNVLGNVAIEEITKIDTNSPIALEITRIGCWNKNNDSYSK